VQIPGRLIGSLVALVAVLAPSGSDASARGHDDGLIAFQRTARGGETAIYLMDTHGLNERRLVEGCCFDWSPDGMRIAYQARDGIYVVNVDGTSQRRLSSSTWIGDLDWSPDGRQVAYAAADGIYVVRLTGARPVRITHSTGSSLDSDMGPRWSPTDAVLAFERYRERSGHGEDIAVMNADGSNQRVLTGGIGTRGLGTWAPTGRRLTYDAWNGTYDDSDSGWDIYLVDADGTGRRALMRTRAYDVDPVWSTGGAKIAFRSKPANGGGWDIHVIDPSGRRHRNLTRSRRYDGQPAWSLDGKRILFVSARTGNSEIYVMSATGRDPTPLTATPAGTRNSAPAWSPAG
jgi:Tol biopolymer transport system component